MSEVFACGSAVLSLPWVGDRVKASAVSCVTANGSMVGSSRSVPSSLVGSCYGVLSVTPHKIPNSPQKTESVKTIVLPKCFCVMK